MLALDERIGLANTALVLVLIAAVAAVWSAPWLSLLSSAAAVLGFNFVFVPPRGSFMVGLQQHMLLLVTILSVSWIVALLVARLREHAALATGLAVRADRLRQLGDELRGADDPAAQVAALQRVLAGIGDADTAVLLAGSESGVRFGSMSSDEAAGLRLCLQQGHAMGPGTGRYEEQPAWYLPLRGRHGTRGAVLVRLFAGDAATAGLFEHTQALCDQLGAALERSAALQAAAAAREEAGAHALRNTLLTAVSHDHRTPLAAILGAASSLHDQDDRLSPAQRRRLAATIVDEATQLSRLTDNTLQLARLGAVGTALQRDWESVEEIVGTVLRRVRQRDPARRVTARVEPGLPLVRCDAVLMVQLLDNLVDNALEHGGSDLPVEVVARRAGGDLIIAVRDRGRGVAPQSRERIFEAFQRGGDDTGTAQGGRRARPGAGVGLALCRAIAQAHGGSLRLRPRARGGSSFEVSLPVDALPDGTLPVETGMAEKEARPGPPQEARS